MTVNFRYCSNKISFRRYFVLMVLNPALWYYVLQACNVYEQCHTADDERPGTCYQPIVGDTLAAYNVARRRLEQRWFGTLSVSAAFSVRWEAMSLTARTLPGRLSNISVMRRVATNAICCQGRLPIPLHAGSDVDLLLINNAYILSIH